MAKLASIVTGLLANFLSYKMRVWIRKDRLILVWIRKDRLILVMLILFYAAVFGSRTFWLQQPPDLEANLRWLTSSLLQIYGAIFAIGPAISLAFSSFFASRYPSDVARDFWKWSGIRIFLTMLSLAIVLCSVILASIDSSSPQNNSDFLLLEFCVLPLVIYATVNLLRNLFSMAGLDPVLQYFRENIKTKKETDEVYAAYHSFLYQLANNRNLADLGSGVSNLFEMVLLKDSIYDDMRRTLKDINRIYSADGEIICLNALDDMIDEGYALIAASNNIALINEAADHLSQSYSTYVTGGKKGPISFYKHHIRGKKWAPEMDQRIMKIISRLEGLEVTEIEVVQSPEITFFVNMSLFLLSRREIMAELQKRTYSEEMMLILRRMVERYSEIEIMNLTPELRGRLDAVIDQLVQLKGYFDESSEEFNRFMEMLRVTPSPKSGTLIRQLVHRMIGLAR